MTLTDKLRAALLEDCRTNDRSIRELARRLGYSHVSVGRWLNGRSEPSAGLLDAAYAYLNVVRSPTNMPIE